MQLLNKISHITNNTVKTVRNASIGLALISTLQACDSATGASASKTPEETIRNNEDIDIEQFEATLPYHSQWNQPIPAISEEEYNRIENQLGYNTLRSVAQNSKPTMDSIEHIVLHSTEHQPGKEEQTIQYLKITGKIHFLVKRDGSIIQYLPTDRDRIVQTNHIGKGSDEVSNASWNRDKFITFKSIGIEVSATPAQTWNNAQYETIKKLLGYLGQKYNLVQKDIITHTMVAYSKPYGLMRKHDPFGIERDKLGLAPGSAQINKDVVSGDIAPNLVSMYERLRKPKIGTNPGGAMNHEQAIEYLQTHYSGVDNAIALHKRRYGGINPTAQFGKNEKVWWMIADINANMKQYVAKKIVQKKGVKKTHYKKKRR